jgi:hypothetical protein
VHSVRRLVNFIDVFLFGVDRSKSARNQESSSRGALNSHLASVDSGLQLNLEIALSGASAKVKPPTGFSARPKCVETSDDVIEDDFAGAPDSRIWDLSPMPLGVAKTARKSAKSRDGLPEFEAWGDLQPYCRKNDSRPRLILFGQFDRRDTHCLKVL